MRLPGGEHRVALLIVIFRTLHLVVSVAHGSAHTGAGVELSGLSLAFVMGVILTGPLVGLAWMWKHAVVGARIVGVTMAASLVFGLVNHFIIEGADRVDHVIAHSRVLFVSTAAMLVITEAAGAVLGLEYGRSRRALRTTGR